MSIVAAIDNLESALQEYFGFDQFKPGQREVTFEAILSAPDLDAPSTSGTVSLSMQRVTAAGFCGEEIDVEELEISVVVADLDVESDTEQLLEFRLVTPGGLVLEHPRHVLDDDLATTRFQVALPTADQEYCVEVVATDLAGNAAEPEEVCQVFVVPPDPPPDRQTPGVPLWHHGSSPRGPNQNL